MTETIYVAPVDHVAELRAELGGDATILGDRLVSAPGPQRPAAWVHDVWLAPERIPIASISAAARALRERGRNWVLVPTAHHRRAALIAAQLPPVAVEPLAFPSPLPASSFGAWTLVERDLMIASPRCASPFPAGEPRIVEDHRGPPSRAYLKLYEALTLAQHWPARGQHCVDLGASPGGWTWVLARLGARVTSVDKAPLAPRVLALPDVAQLEASAFGLDPASLPAVDWLVSDIICYPDRMLRLLGRWLAAHPRAKYVSTIKFKGAVDMAPVSAFVTAHGGTLRHLFHGKHELTWIRIG